MKKILLLCDGDHFPMGATKFIRQMRETDTLYVKGIFFTAVDTMEIIPVGFLPVTEPYVRLKEKVQAEVSESQARFIQSFENAGIKYEIHPYSAGWDVDLFKIESRFADLVVISEDLFCKNALESQPSFFMAEALRAAECPVVVVPEHFKTVDSVAIAYDGQKESMYAIKQFIYLFPELADHPVDIVYIKQDSNDVIPNHDLLREYSLSHFQSQFTSKLHFDPKKYFTSWL